MCDEVEIKYHINRMTNEIRALAMVAHEMIVGGQYCEISESALSLGHLYRKREKVEVYSFGVLLLEIGNEDTSFADMPRREQ